MTVISGARRWGRSWHSRGTEIVAVLVAPACSATLGDRMGGAGAVSDLWGRPRRSRSPRRCAPLSAAPASRPSGPSCANACASTTPVSVSLSKLSNSAASPSAAPTAGTCHPDAHRRLPTPSHPATVPHQGRSRERNDHRPHSAPSVVQLTSAQGAQRNTVFVVFDGLLTV